MVKKIVYLLIILLGILILIIVNLISKTRIIETGISRIGNGQDVKIVDEYYLVRLLGLLTKDGLIVDTDAIGLAAGEKKLVYPNKFYIIMTDKVRLNDKLTAGNGIYFGSSMVKVKDDEVLFYYWIQNKNSDNRNINSLMTKYVLDVVMKHQNDTVNANSNIMEKFLINVISTFIFMFPGKYGLSI